MTRSIRTSFSLIAVVFSSVFGLASARANTVEYHGGSIELIYDVITYLDLDSNGTADLEIFISQSDESYLYGNPGVPANVAVTGADVARFGPDVSIGPSLDYAIYGNIDVSSWVSASDGYFGYKFLHNASTAYGWAHIVITNGGTQASVTEWAYDTSGASILTGAKVSAVPEPAACAALLGLAALGCVVWHKRRRPGAQRSQPSSQL